MSGLQSWCQISGFAVFCPWSSKHIRLQWPIFKLWDVWRNLCSALQVNVDAISWMPHANANSSTSLVALLRGHMCFIIVRCDNLHPSTTTIEGHKVIFRQRKWQVLCWFSTLAGWDVFRVLANNTNSNNIHKVPVSHRFPRINLTLLLIDCQTHRLWHRTLGSTT